MYVQARRQTKPHREGARVRAPPSWHRAPCPNLPGRPARAQPNPQEVAPSSMSPAADSPGRINGPPESPCREGSGHLQCCSVLLAVCQARPALQSGARTAAGRLLVAASVCVSEAGIVSRSASHAAPVRTCPAAARPGWGTVALTAHTTPTPPHPPQRYRPCRRAPPGRCPCRHPEHLHTACLA